MSILIGAILERRRVVMAVLVLLSLLGVRSYMTLPKEGQPQLSWPMIFVNASLDGASPQDAERLLSVPLEKALQSQLKNYQRITSNSAAGGASIKIRFKAGYDPDDALERVTKIVDDARSQLPDEADRPTIRGGFSHQEPLLGLALSGSGSDRQLQDLAKHLDDSITALPSVLKVETYGARSRQVEIVVDPAYLHEHSAISVHEIGALVKNLSISAATGSLDRGSLKFKFRTPNLARSIDDLKNIRIQQENDDAVRLGDVAKVYDTLAKPSSYSRVNGQKQLVMYVYKSDDATAINAATAVKVIITKQKVNWPQNFKLEIVHDLSEDLSDEFHTLRNGVILAIVLVMALTTAAIEPRSSLLVGFAIPGSFVLTFLMLECLGLTLNTMVLFGLVISVGILVDSAIVVAEYAAQQRAAGRCRQQAYTTAARRLAGPVVSSTATTMAAFAPLLFWPGILGQLLSYVPITLLVVLASSLVVALIFMPTLGTVLGASGAVARTGRNSTDGGHGTAAAYARLLRALLHRPGWVVMATVAVLVAIWASWTHYGQVAFWYDRDPRNLELKLKTVDNLSLDERDALVRKVEDRMRELPASDIDKITATVSDSGSTVGKIKLWLADWQSRRPVSDIMTSVWDAMPKLAGLHISGDMGATQGGTIGKAVEIGIYARNLQALQTAVTTVRNLMQTTGTFINIEDSTSKPGVEWQLTLDRTKAAQYGVNARDVSTVVQMATGGFKLGDYLPDDAEEPIDIMLRFPKNSASFSALSSLFVNSAAQGPILLSNFVTFSPEKRASDIYHKNGERVITITADVKSGLAQRDQIQSLKTSMQTLSLPSGAHYVFGGQDEEERESRQFLAQAFAIALFVICIILLIQFDNFYELFVILTAVVMASVGMFLGLLLFGRPFSIVLSGIGAMALAGIIVNNNIVLVDAYRCERQNGHGEAEAILRAAASRLRPVLLTTATTVIGLLPMVFGLSLDLINLRATWGDPELRVWMPLATPIVCGLLFATPLTLVVTPCLLQLRARWRERRKNVAVARANHIQEGG